ncbi:m16 family peptidase [Clostridium sp. CAG:921]|nr:m16 family peptidase [Clostridium sp. CAG:921]
MDITKELLYTCYDTFYNLANMFFVVVGDVDVDSTLNLIDDTLKLYVKSDENKNVAGDVKRFYLDEPKQINQKQIVQKMDIFMPQVCLGYKLNTVKGEEIIKRAIIADIVSKMYFSKLSNFYEVEYNKKILNDEVIISYEGSNTFSHIMVLAESTDVDLLKSDLLEYIEKIKKSEIDEALFNEVKKSKIGTTIMYNDSLSSCYRRIIDAILVDVDIYSDVNIVENITTNDVKEFLQLFDENYMCTSIIDRINK